MKRGLNAQVQTCDARCGWLPAAFIGCARRAFAPPVRAARVRGARRRAFRLLLSSLSLPPALSLSLTAHSFHRAPTSQASWLVGDT